MTSWRDGLQDNAILAIENLLEEYNFKDYQVSISKATKKGDNFLGVIYRVYVSGTKYGKRNINWSFILKCSPLIKMNIRLDPIFEREFFVYKTMLPSFRNMEMDFGVPEEDRFRFAHCQGGDMTSGKQLLILNDLKSEGYVMENKRESLSFEQMVLLCKSLAHFHSFSFAMKMYNPDRFEAYTKYALQDHEFPVQLKPFVIASFERAADVIEDESHKKKIQDLASNSFERMISLSVPSEDEPYKVLCHGDCWINNFMFKFKNDKVEDVCLLDWQVLKYTYPIVDLAHLIFCCTDDKLRADKRFEDLLDIYYDNMGICVKRLGLNIDDCFPKQVYKKQILEVMPFGLIMGIYMAPIVMSDDEDVMDLKETLDMESFNKDGYKFSIEAKERYEKRIKGLVNDFARLNLL